jgi:hypothetical protein
MQRYLLQLLADLETAARNAPAASTYSFLSSPFDEEESETAAFYVRLVRLYELFELSPDAFPPVDRLTKLQVAELLTAFEKLWRAWHIAWECPPRLSARRRYAVMVDWMRREVVRYHPDRGASIDFCEHRQQGACPFGEGGKCWCEEMEASVRHDLESWEHTRVERLAEELRPSSPVEEFYNWLQADDCDDDYPWEDEAEGQRFRQFMMAEDPNAWLYFYRPEVSAELLGEEPVTTPEDFEDFDWEDESSSGRHGRRGEEEDDYDLPF